MNLTLEKRNNVTVDLESVNEIAVRLGLHPKLVELLFLRGLSDEKQISEFITPNKKNLHDPFLLKGMNEAVERIRSAIENDEKIVVYGDYDADGICASSILSLFLVNNGLNVYTHIPNRIDDGYGLSIESIEKIIDSACPDLIITCDCGISGFTEVEYAMDLGVDVIVTDHHEVPEKMPNCIVVNPKQSDCQYPFKYLSGAGVVLKLVQAVSGMEEAEKYFDLATIATVADLVPLVDENRLIVQLGLKQLESGNNLGLKTIFLNQEITKPYSSSDIAFKIAPRINAAGRMGDAYRAFELLTTMDALEAKTLVNDINEDNGKRKGLCDKLYNEACDDLAFEDMVHNRAIILSHDDWEKGITGIVAARLAGDYKRPSFILVNCGDSYKGTSRSVNGINIFDMLASVSDILIEFGGHSQAAGFSIKSENIPLFKTRINKYLDNFSESYFLPSMEYDMEIDCNDIDFNFIKSLEVIEPCGNSNSKPLFKVAKNDFSVSACKSNINHTIIATENELQIWAFNNTRFNQFLLGKDKKEMLLELQVNLYNGKELPRAVLKGLKTSEFYINDEIANAGFIKTGLVKSSVNPQYQKCTREELKEFASHMYGTLFICASKQTYLEYEEELQTVQLKEFLYAANKNNYSRIIVSPEFDEFLTLSLYDKIVFLDKPINDNIIGFINKRSKASVYIADAAKNEYLFRNVSLERAEFIKYYELVKNNPNVTGSSVFSYYKALNSKSNNANIVQFMTCFTIFVELGIFTIDKSNFSVKINSDKKVDLQSSELLKQFIQIKSKV